MLNLILIDADTAFFVFLNQQHTDINLTTEKQTHNQLSFLDLLITNNGQNFPTSFDRKKHFIGLYIIYVLRLFHIKLVLLKHYIKPLLSVAIGQFFT